MTSDLTPERAALKRAADILGGQSALASALGYSDRRNVTPWFKSDGPRFPAEHCPTLERATREAPPHPDGLKPVTCEELRSDVPWEVLRLQTAPTDHQEAA
jgi:DNA-binding transcriptional regulator YdaS (Cro superfamily)